MVFRKGEKRNLLIISKHFKKYLGTYEVYHYAPHTTELPKLSKSFLHITKDKSEFVHSLFECHSGHVEQVDGHIFLLLRNREQKNAPFYFILKSINDANVNFLSGSCLGIGQNQNCHPIAVKVALQKRNDITDFTIEKYKSYCYIEELPPEKVMIEPYKTIVREFLWNNCPDKDILF